MIRRRGYKVESEMELESREIWSEVVVNGNGQYELCMHEIF